MSRCNNQRYTAAWVSQGSVRIAGQDPLTSPHNHRGRGSIHTGYMGSHTHYVLCVWLQSIYFSHRGVPRNQLRFLWTWDQG